LFNVINACNCKAAAKAAEAVNTICPPHDIHPVNHDAALLDRDGDNRATQWYWPTKASIVAFSQASNMCDYSPPAVGYIDAISPREQATAMVARKVMMLWGCIRIDLEVDEQFMALTSCRTGMAHHRSLVLLQ
jgi:hypothetical protein